MDVVTATIVFINIWSSGDMVKYFLHVYSPEDKEDELTSSYELEQMHTSLKFETGKGLKRISNCLTHVLYNNFFINY